MLRISPIVEFLRTFSEKVAPTVCVLAKVSPYGLSRNRSVRIAAQAKSTLGIQLAQERSSLAASGGFSEFVIAVRKSS
jgi:hypothetical protein